MSETTRTPVPDERPEEEGTFVGGSFGTEEDGADPEETRPAAAADVDGPDAEHAEVRRTDVEGVAARTDAEDAAARTDVEGVAAPTDVPPGERNEPV